ncbi:MAG: hypothetical protein DLM70_19600 [Chloroflexi bacterium]|nr:MAG: hypothetical protein DLM70_19600 [Chloroflexota bacterium]
MTRPLLYLVLLLAAGFGTSSVAATATIPSLTVYIHQFHSVRMALDRAELSRPNGDARKQAALKELRSLRQVRFPNGRVLVVNTPQLSAEISSRNATEIRAELSRIDRLDNDLRSAKLSVLSRRHSQDLERTLRDSRFHLSQSPFERLRDWLFEQALLLVSSLHVAVGVSPLVQLLFVLGFLGGVAGVAVLVARGALSTMVAHATREEAKNEPVTASDARAQTHSAVAAGDYRNALRHLFLGTLLELQDRDALRLAPGLTNREYVTLLREQASREDRPGPLSRLVDEFDAVWYGHRDLTREQYEVSAALASETLSHAPTRRAA